MKKYLILLIAILFTGISLTSGQNASPDWLSPNDAYVIPSYQPTPIEYWWNAPYTYSHYSYYYNSYDPWWNVNVYHSPYRTYYSSWYPYHWGYSWSGNYWRTYGSYTWGNGIFLS